MKGWLENKVNLKLKFTREYKSEKLCNFGIRGATKRYNWNLKLQLIEAFRRRCSITTQSFQIFLDDG